MRPLEMRLKLTWQFSNVRDSLKSGMTVKFYLEKIGSEKLMLTSTALMLFSFLSAPIS